MFLSLQELAGSWLSQLMDSCQTRASSPNSKIIRNICVSACCDPHHTPRVCSGTKGGGILPSQTNRPSKQKRSQISSPVSEDGQEGEDWMWDVGIISLSKLEQVRN